MSALFHVPLVGSVEFDVSIDDFVAAAAPAPSVTSCSPNNGPIAGNTAIAIAGANFVNGATVTIGGASATSVTWISAIEIDCHTPAGSAGAANVVVTNPDAQTSGASGNGAFTYTSVFDPATLNLSWWTRSFSSVPWSGRASLGTSGGNAFNNTTGHDPTSGSPVGGINAAILNGTNQSLQSTQTLDNVVSGSAASFAIVFFATAAVTDTGATTWYDMPLLFGADSATRWGVVFSSAGVRFGNFDGGGWSSVAVAASTGAIHLAMGFHDGVNLNLSIDGGAFSQVARGASSLNALPVACGRDGDLGVNFFTGRIYEQIASNAVLTPTNFNNIKSYVNATYGTSF